MTLLLKLSPPSFVEVLITALFSELGERPEWRAPCVGLFRPGEQRVDAVDAFKDLAARLQLDPEAMLLKHFMRDRAPPELLVFHRTHGATLSMERAAPGATQTLVRTKTAAGAGELDVDVELVPLCRWIANAAPHGMTYVDACARAGGADKAVVWDLFAALEEAGFLEATIEAPPASRVVRRIAKR